RGRQSRAQLGQLFLEGLGRQLACALAQKVGEHADQTLSARGVLCGPAHEREPDGNQRYAVLFHQPGFDAICTRDLLDLKRERIRRGGEQAEKRDQAANCPPQWARRHRPRYFAEHPGPRWLGYFVAVGIGEAALPLASGALSVPVTDRSGLRNSLATCLISSSVLC